MQGTFVVLVEWSEPDAGGNTNRGSGTCILEPIHSQGYVGIFSLVLKDVQNRRLFPQTP